MAAPIDHGAPFVKLIIRQRPLLFSLFLAVLSFDAFSATSEFDKAADIHRLLEVTGAITMGSRMIDQLLTIEAQAQPNVPDQVWAEIREEIDFDDFEPAIVQIYSNHFTAAEINALLAFYESDIGRRFTEKQPAVLQDSIAAGQAWAMDIQDKLRAKLAQRGFESTPP